MRNRYLILILLLSSMFASTSFSANEPEETLNVEADHAWGLLLGDEVNVRVDLTKIDAGIDQSSLPQQEKRYGTWLYLKTIDVDAEQMVFHYQIINVPLKNTSIATPKFDVKRSDELWISVPPASLTIGPALAVTDGAPSDIKTKPDMKPTLINTVEARNKIKLFAGIAVLSALILAFWHLGWKTKQRQPFAQAVHDLSRLKWHRSVTPDQASRILHNAFNQTAGTIVVYGEIDNLLQQHAWLAPLQDEITSFYKQSEQHFFARNSGQEPDIDMIRKLAKACRSKEMLA